MDPEASWMELGVRQEGGHSPMTLSRQHALGQLHELHQTSWRIDCSNLTRGYRLEERCCQLKSTELEQPSQSQSCQSGVQPDWVKEEVRLVLATLDETERAEMEAWLLTTRLRGSNARAARANKWSSWYQRG